MASQAVQAPSTISTDNIAVLAYQLWQQRGCPIGSPEVDWFRAELELSENTRGVENAAYAELTASPSQA